jgi:hypothetical protein
MTYPAAKSCGVSEGHAIPKASPPNVLIGGPFPVSPGFPLKTCGNDGVFGKEINETQQAAEN